MDLILLSATVEQAPIEFNIPPALILGLIVSTILPVVTGLVTTRVTSGAIKATILAALSALTGLGTELMNALQTNTTYNIGTGILLALTAFIVGTAMHFGLWKPVTVADKAQALFSKNTVTVHEDPSTRPGGSASGDGLR